MTRQKDLKRLVRARMKKTGEAYTAARTQILRKPKKTTRRTPAPATRAASTAPALAPETRAATPKPPTDPRDYASIAGMSDDAIEAKTGCTWERWVFALDRHGADKLPHREIAELVSKKYKVGDWWTQMVTVGYERIKGLRARGQRRDGSYEANKSRTFDVPVKTLFDAWADPGIRQRWLNGAPVKIRTATAPKSMRLGWSDGTLVAVGFMAKGKDRSSVALAHAKLPNRETADRLKKYWGERLDALGEVLADGV